MTATVNGHYPGNIDNNEHGADTNNDSQERQGMSAGLNGYQSRSDTNHNDGSRAEYNNLESQKTRDSGHTDGSYARTGDGAYRASNGNDFSATQQGYTRRQSNDPSANPSHQHGAYVPRSGSRQNQYDSGLRDPGAEYDSQSVPSGRIANGGHRDTSLSAYKGPRNGSPIQPKPPASPHDKPTPLRMCELDRHVVATPSQLLPFPAFELVQYLTQAARTEVEIAYVIYRWVTCLEVKQEEKSADSEEKGMLTETGVPTVKDYVEQLDKGVLKHADLFSILCKCVNLETHKVSGRVRHYASQPSPQLCRSQQASWSAILLQAGWGLVDCSLGAKHWVSTLRDRDHKRATVLASSRVKPHHMHAPHNFYFLPQPEVLLTSHLPDNPCWQLLPHPVAEMDFFSGLLLTPHLHFMGVELVYPTSLKVKDIAEEAEVTWTLKGEEYRKFAYRLYCVSDDGFSHKDLTRYGFLETLLARGHVRLRLIPPNSGRYVCELYGAHVPSRLNEMTHMCSFDMDFAKTTSSALKFPENERVEWGPGAECLWVGMRPKTHEAGYFQVEKGQAEIVFSCSKPVLVTQKLFVAEEEGSGDEVPYSTVNFRDVHNKVRMLLRIPTAGDYILSVYAKGEAAAGKCQLVCNYLVLCDSGLPQQIRRFPPVAYNKLGPTKAFSDFGMNLVCPRKSCIVVAPFSGKVLFAFSTTDNVELSSDLQLSGRDGSEQSDMSDYVQHARQEDETTFRARLPKAGDYIFYLYGKSLTGEAHKFLLYSAIVECSVPCRDCLPLPKVVRDWRSRVQILAPLRKYLVLGAVTHFAVRAYKVKAVRIQGHVKSHLFSHESDEDDDKGKGDDDAEQNSTEVTEKNNNDKLSQQTDVDTSDKKDREKKDVGDDRSKGSAPDAEKDTRKENTVDAEQEEQEKDEGGAEQEGRNARAVEKAEGSGDGEEAGVGEGEGWQVWRCSVTVSSEDEGSGVKLYLHDALSDGAAVCVAEFEVLTERKMASKLDQQQAMWNEAEQTLRHRPDSGHRSDLDDEETQVAYFLDDEIYVSNPLGDDQSDDSDDDSDDNDDEYEERRDTRSSSHDDYEEEKVSQKSDRSKRSSTKTNGSTESSLTGDVQKQHSSQMIRQKTNAANLQTPQGKRGKSKERKSNARTVMMNKVYTATLRSPFRKKANRVGVHKQATPRDKKPAANKEPSSGQIGRDDVTDKGKNSSRDNKQGYRETHNPDMCRSEGRIEKNLRRKLWKACQRRDREAIQKAVNRYTRGGYAPCADLAAAERMLHFFELRDALVEAVESKSVEDTRRCLTEVERNGYAGEMSAVCRQAHTLLSPQRTLRRQHTLVEADMRTLLEIRSYRCPPDAVHNVIVAMLLLMGVHEGLTKKWSRCQRRLQVLGPQGVWRRMTRVRAGSIHPEIAARAHELLHAHTEDEAHNAGPGVLAIFKWCHGVLASMEQLPDLEKEYGNEEPIQPATKKRQRQIFKEQANNTADDENTKMNSTNSSFSTNNNHGNTLTNRRQEQKRSVSKERKQDEERHVTKKETKKESTTARGDVTNRDQKRRKERSTTAEQQKQPERSPKAKLADVSNFKANSENNYKSGSGNKGQKAECDRDSAVHISSKEAQNGENPSEGKKSSQDHRSDQIKNCSCDQSPNHGDERNTSPGQKPDPRVKPGQGSEASEKFDNGHEHDSDHHQAARNEEHAAPADLSVDQEPQEGHSNNDRAENSVAKNDNKQKKHVDDHDKVFGTSINNDNVIDNRVAQDTERAGRETPKNVQRNKEAQTSEQKHGSRPENSEQDKENSQQDKEDAELQRADSPHQNGGKATPTPTVHQRPAQPGDSVPKSPHQESPKHRRATQKSKGVTKKEMARSRLSAATRRPRTTLQPVFHSTYFSSPGAAAKTNREENSKQTDPRGQPSGQ